MSQEMHRHRKIMPKISKKCQNQKLFQLIVLLMSQEMHRHQLLIGWPLVPLIEAGIINIWTKNFHYDLCIGSLRFSANWFLALLLSQWFLLLLSNPHNDHYEGMVLSSVSRQKWQKFIQKIYKWKVLKTILFFTCILPNYVSHESHKEFWKNSHFENMKADFLGRCSIRNFTKLLNINKISFLWNYLIKKSRWSKVLSNFRKCRSAYVH